jgi:hypothetical protein
MAHSIFLHTCGAPCAVPIVQRLHKAGRSSKQKRSDQIRFVAIFA